MSTACLLLHKTRNGIQLGDIELHRSGLVRPLALNECIEVFLPATNADHEDALLDESLSDGKADAWLVTTWSGTEFRLACYAKLRGRERESGRNEPDVAPTTRTFLYGKAMMVYDVVRFLVLLVRVQ